MREFIKEELHEKLKKTILLTTHYMEEADDLCDRVAFMYGGKIKALDTPALLKKSMPQEQVLEVKCLGDFERVVFDKMEELAGLHLSKKDGFTYVRMNTENPEDILSQIVDLLQNKAKILSVIVTSPTLEDVFVHLTGASLKNDYTQERRTNTENGTRWE